MHRLKEAEELLNHKKSAEALAMLKSIDASALGPNERSYRDILLAEVGMLGGDYSLASGLDQAIETFRFDADTSKFAKAKYLKGWLLVTQGKYAQAQEVLLESYSNYLRCQQLEGAARAMNRTAHVSLRLGDTDSAIESLMKSGDIYRRLGKHLRYAGVSNNLAYLYALTGRLGDSLSEFATKEAVLDKLSNVDKLHYWLGIALALGLKGETAHAKDNIKQCLPLMDEHPYERALYHEFSGWISFMENDLAAAEGVLLRCLNMFPQSAGPNQSDILRPKRLLGELYFLQRKWRQSEDFANQAYETARACNEQAELAACYRIFGRIDHHKKDRDSARRWFDRALDLFDLIKYRYELADTRYLAASSNLYSPEETAEMLAGARDYFQSENVIHRLEQVNAAIAKIQKTSRASKAVAPPTRTDTAGRTVDCPNIISGSPQMKKLLSLAERVSPGEMNILITGETGTGKDLMAKYIHYHSGRTGRVVSVNAAAVPDSMVESELFGYARGAFTGAEREKPGLFEIANEGTFFLDEIADASPSFQAKLLEVIESRKVRRLGETLERSANFRLIAATNQNLDGRIQQKQFRADLFHRINEFSIHLPPLRDRQEDFLPLTEFFLRTSGLDPHGVGQEEHTSQLSQALSKREWPGNIRQLRAEINYLVVIADRDISRMVAVAEQSQRRSDEYQKILQALEKAGGNQSLAARTLGIPESTLRYRLAKYRKKT